MADVNETQIREWHEEGLQVVSAYKRCEYRLVYLLAKISESHGYRLYKSESLRQYAVCVWGLPDNAAADLVTVANKAVEIPAMIEALEGGRTTVSKLRKICPVIDTKNYKEWIGLTIECSARIVERAVAMTKAETAIYDQLTYKFGNRIEMKAGVSEAVMFKLQRVRDLLSQQTKKSASIEDAIDAVADDFLKRHDPVIKAERARARAEKRAAAEREEQTEVYQEQRGEALAREGSNVEKAKSDFERGNVSRAESFANQSTEELVHGFASPENSDPLASYDAEQNKNVTCRVPSEPATKSVSPRKKIPAATVHFVNLRDGGQCTEINATGERCENRRWLETHHIVPLSRGGTDEPENLTTLCSSHHRLHHFAEARGGAMQTELMH